MPPDAGLGALCDALGQSDEGVVAQPKLGRVEHAVTQMSSTRARGTHATPRAAGPFSLLHVRLRQRGWVLMPAQPAYVPSPQLFDRRRAVRKLRRRNQIAKSNDDDLVAV